MCTTTSTLARQVRTPELRIMAENISLDSDARSELQNYAEDVLNDLLSQIIETNLMKER